LLFLVSPTSSLAQSLGEDDVVRLAHEHGPNAAVAEAIRKTSEARTRAAAPFENPRIGWEREGVGGATEDTFALSIPVRIAQTLTERSLVASESAWSRAEASLSQADAAREALLAYQEVAIARLQLGAVERAVTDLEEATRVLSEREAAGTASGYERTRLSIATELAKSDVAAARAVVDGQKARLASLLQLDPKKLEVKEKVELLADSQLEALLSQGVGDPRANEQVTLARKEAQRAQKRAEWAWLPGAEVKGGLKAIDEAGGSVGYVVGLSLDIPLFDRGQTLRSEARRHVALTEARRTAYTRTLQSRLDAAVLTFRAAKAELERFERQTLAPLKTMLQAAKSGYREGQRSIVELLDAQQAVVQIEERRAHLIGVAKRAEIELRAAVGDLS
jgi:cobalt-zinc-cadmium efflux system outer membrane protein